MKTQPYSFAPTGRRQKFNWRYLWLPFYAVVLAAALAGSLVTFVLALAVAKIPGVNKIVWPTWLASATLTLALALIIGGEVWFLTQGKLPEAAVVTPKEKIELVELKLPADFAGCEAFNCATLPYRDLESYQRKLLAAASKTASQRVYLALAMTYLYQRNDTKYFEYINLAQELDPSVQLTH